MEAVASGARARPRGTAAERRARRGAGAAGDRGGAYSHALPAALNRVNVAVLVPMMVWTAAQYALFYRREMLPAWLSNVNPACDIARGHAHDARLWHGRRTGARAQVADGARVLSDPRGASHLIVHARSGDDQRSRRARIRSARHVLRARCTESTLVHDPLLASAGAGCRAARTKVPSSCCSRSRAVSRPIRRSGTSNFRVATRARQPSARCFTAGSRARGSTVSSSSFSRTFCSTR